MLLLLLLLRLLPCRLPGICLAGVCTGREAKEAGPGPTPAVCLMYERCGGSCRSCVPNVLALRTARSSRGAACFNKREGMCASTQPGLAEVGMQRWVMALQLVGVMVLELVGVNWVGEGPAAPEATPG